MNSSGDPYCGDLTYTTVDSYGNYPGFLPDNGGGSYEILKSSWGANNVHTVTFTVAYDSYPSLTNTVDLDIEFFQVCTSLSFSTSEY